LKWTNSDKDRYNIDADIAKKTAKRLGIQFTEVEMPPPSFIPSLLNNFVKAMDEPNANPTGISMMILYATIAKDGHRLALTGDGADEVFGGYQRYDNVKKINKFPELNSIFLKRLLDVDFRNKTVKNIAYSFLSRDSNKFWENWHFNTNNRYLKKLIPDLNLPDVNIFGSELSSIFKDNKISNLMFKDLRTWICMESNRKLDRVSMWNSIEARSPFQSEAVIGSGYKNMEISNFQKTNKEILIESYPELKFLVNNPGKLGFISPVGHWLRCNPDLVNYTLENLTNIFPFNRDEMHKISKGPLERNFEKIKLLWTLVVLNSWITDKEIK
jgi:asparagine synthase (glutamine-hydrolysing)